jgi:hypothetical protein
MSQNKYIDTARVGRDGAARALAMNDKSVFAISLFYIPFFNKLTI